MSKRRLSAKNILILTGINLLLSAIISISTAYLLELPTLWTMALINMIANTPLLLACSDALRQELGLRSPTHIVGNWTRKIFGRKIVVNAGDKKTDIFMQTLALSSSNKSEIIELETITVWYDDNEYTISMSELEEFLYVSWLRQTQTKNAFSRDYWTKQRNPRMKTLRYNIIMLALTNCDGLITDRSEKRSGTLNIRPDLAMKIIKDTY